jgi:PEGA domain
VRLPIILVTGTVVILLGVGAWLLLKPVPAPAPAPVPRTVEAPRPTPAAPPPEPVKLEREAVKRVTPKAAEPAPSVAPVEAAPTTGSLLVEADVEGATVFLDRVGVGTAPMTIPNITPGSHRLNVSATGYDGYAETIDVQPGPRTISIAFKEVKLDVKLDAVHKHGVGSCRGVLSATPQGLKYQAADGKDSFTVALSDFDTFEVDYLAKNLRLKTKQGKTYNFGDPDGNADRLFVFHRDVEKARKRILTGH